MTQDHTPYIQLNTREYDPFIDYVKGVCILFVVLNHCLPPAFMDSTLFCLWGSTAVPLFLVLQVFHAFKRGTDSVSVSITKIWHRVLWPFLLAEIIIIGLYYYKQVVVSNTTVAEFAKTTILWGGIGPGCYYPWIYVQFALLMPIIAMIVNRLNGKWLLVFFIIISTFTEIVLPFHIPTRIYRLLFLRYFFLFYIGYVLVFRGIVVNRLTTILSVLSMIATLFFFYVCRDYYPGISRNFSICNWICYLYIAYGFLCILKRSYQYLCHYPPVERLFRWMGVHSYDIFLLQMLLFAIIDLTGYNI